MPLVNILNGGKHAIDSTDFQEFMIAPLGAPTFREGLRWAAETFHALGALLHERGFATTVGDEGGYAPEPRRATRTAIGARARGDRASGVSRRASRSRSRSTRPRPSSIGDGALHPGPRGAHARHAAELIDFWADWVDRYPIVSLEDGLAEDDWEGWTRAHRAPRRTDPARRRRPAGDEHRAPGAGDPRASRQQHPRQAQPDRDPDRDDRGGRDGSPRRLDARSSAIGPARPRTRPSPTWWSPSNRARSRPAR